MSVVALRKFLRSITVAFDGKRAFNRVVEFWRDAIRGLRNKARTLADYMKDLKLTRGTRQGREVALVGGRVEGARFAALMRTARSVDAFEAATGSRLSALGRQAFRRLDDIAELHFPDLALRRRATYLLDSRNDLLARKVIGSNEIVLNAETLEKIVRRDAKLTDRVNSVSKVTSRTKKIVFLGVTVAVTGIGIAYLCREAAKHAAANSGCFMYINDNGNVRRCRALGCSCFVDNNNVKLIDPIVDAVTCRDEDLWERMRPKNSDCSRDRENRKQNERFCVHCDWNEIDPQSTNYVDKEALPENAYVRCEHQDALDALNEMIGGTIDSVWDVVGSTGKQARDSFASSVRVLPWILGVFGVLIALVVATVAWRFFGKNRDYERKISSSELS